MNDIAVSTLVRQSAERPAQPCTSAGGLKCVLITPARNEAAFIELTIKSVIAQSVRPLRWVIVSDGSTDGTGTIAGSFPAVTVIRSSEPDAGVTGKCNALMLAVAQEAKSAPTGDMQPGWLLFTDADTFHFPGSLATAVDEAEEHGVDLLSYSPEQEALTWSERALMPVVFSNSGIRRSTMLAVCAV